MFPLPIHFSDVFVCTQKYTFEYCLCLCTFCVLFFKFFFFLAVLGLHCYTGAFSSCGERGLLIAMTSLVLERRLSSCGSRACLVALLHVGSSQTRD